MLFLSYVASTSGGTAILSSRARGRRVTPLNPAVEEDTIAESMFVWKGEWEGISACVCVCVCGNNALCYFLSYVASTSGGTAILSSRARGRRVSPFNPAVEEDTRADSMFVVCGKGNGKE